MKPGGKMGSIKWARRRLIAAVAALSTTFALVPVTTVSVAANPATDNLVVRCEVTPEQSTATFGGIPAAGIGEAIRVGTSVEFEEGTLYQDVLQRPDGSTYFASVIETTWQAPVGLTLIPGSVQFAIDGVALPTVAGTQPQIGSWVLEETPLGALTRYRIYFPGDAGAMLSDPTGAGLPSYVVAAGGQQLSLTMGAYVLDIPSNTSGTIHDAAECFSSISTGLSNRTSDRPHAQVGVLEPELAIDKQSLTGTSVSAGAVVNYRIALTAPLFDPDTLTPFGDPQGITVVDTVPSGMIPLGLGNLPLADGASNLAGGVWNSGTRTLTFNVAHVAAGSTFNIDYPVKVDSGIGTGITLTNNVAATWNAAASAYPTRSYGPIGDDQSVVTAAPAPTIVKTADRPIVGINTTVQYRIQVDFPASGSPFFNATVYDTLPSGLIFDSVQSVVCTTGCTDPVATIAPYTSVANGWTRFGWYLGNLPAGPARTFEIIYNTHIGGTYHDGDAIPLGATFDNMAQVRTNSVDRLGAIVPQAAAVPVHDLVENSVATIEFNRPILEVEKLVNVPEPADTSIATPITFTVRVRNVGGLAAGYFRVSDECAAGCTFSAFDPMASSPGTNLDWYGSTNAGFSFNGALAPGDAVDFVYTVTLIPAHFEDSSNRLRNRVEVENLADPFGVYYPERHRASVERSFLVPNIGTAKSIQAVNGTPYTGQPISTAGANLTYRVVLTNTGTGTGTITSLSDAVPGAFALLSTTPNVAGSQSAPGSPIIFTAPGPWEIAPNGGTFTFDYTVDTNGTGAGTRTNTVTATYSDITGRTRADGREFVSASQAPAVLHAPQLRVQKTPDLADNVYVLDGASTEFRIRVSNDSTTVDASNVSVDDVLPASLTAAPFDAATQVAWSGSGAPSSVAAAPDWLNTNPKFLISNLVPGQVVTITVPVAHDGTDPAPGSERLTNTATVSAMGAGTVGDTGVVTWESTIPNLAISKTPDVGALIPQNGTGIFVIEVRNDSHLVEAAPIVIDDPLPPGLEWNHTLVGPGGPGSNWEILGGGAAGTLALGAGATNTHPIFELSSLLPGQTVRITLQVQQNGSIPPSLDLVNTATATTAGVIVSDTGEMSMVPDIAPPLTTKSVSPAFGPPNTPVQFTLTTVLGALGVPTFDTTVIDSLPDGFVFDSYGSVLCTLGCPGIAEFAGSTLPAVPNADGSTTLGWYFGDRPSGTGPTTYTMAVNARIATVFSGTGLPAAGTAVADAEPGGDPLVNTVRSFINLTDKVTGLLPAIPAVPNTTYDIRSGTRAASFDVRTPNVSIAKSSDESDGEVEVGESLLYTITLTNTGTAPAYDIEFSDDMALGNLASVDTNPAASPLPAGVSIIDPWSVADPTTRWQVAGPLAPGDSIQIRYSGTTLPSDSLKPGESNFPGDVARIRNIARLHEFHAAPTGSPEDFEYLSNRSSASTIRVYTPLPRVYLEPCWSSPELTIGQSFILKAQVQNYYGWDGVGSRWTTFPTTSAGTAYDTSYVVTLPAALDYVPGGTEATGIGVGEPSGTTYVPFADPTVSPDGRILTWDLGDVPPSTDWLRLKIATTVNTVPISGNVTVEIDSTDASGSAVRGDAVGARYDYIDTHLTGECGVPGPATYLYKGPDSASVIVGQTHNFYVSLTHSLGATAVNPVLVDTMPAGLTYVPGSATVVADIPYLETVTTGPGGETIITWSFSGTTGNTISIAVPAGTGPATPLNTVLTNGVSVTEAGGFAGTDIGTLVVKSDAVPTVLKSATPDSAIHGGGFVYTVDVTIPANTEFFDLIAVDQMNQSVTSSGAEVTFGSYLQYECISGCTSLGPDDIVPQPLAPIGSYVGMLLGDVAIDTEPRVVRMRYTASTRPTTHAIVTPILTAPTGWTAAGGTNTNAVTIADSSDTTIPGTAVYDPNDGVQWFSTYSGRGTPRDTATANVEVLVPSAEIQKSCVSLQRADNPGTVGIDIEETEVGVPNARCTLTISNPSEVAAYNITVRDTPKSTADAYDVNDNFFGGYPVSAIELLRYAPYSPAVPWSDGLGYFQWEGIDLDPGESRSFEYDIRYSATPPLGAGYHGIITNEASMPDGWTNAPLDPVQIGNGDATVRFRVVAPNVEVYKTTLHEWNRLIAEQPARDTNPIFSGYSGHYEWPAISAASQIEWVVNMPLTNVSGLSSFDVTDTLPFGFAYTPGSAKILETIPGPTGPIVTSYPIEPSVTPNTTDVCSPGTSNAGGDRLLWNFARSAASPGNRPWFGAYASNPTGMPTHNDGTYGSGVPWTSMVRLVFEASPDAGASHCTNSPGDVWNWVTYNNAIAVNAVVAGGSTLDVSFNDQVQLQPVFPDTVKGRQELSDRYETYGCGSITASAFNSVGNSTALEALCPGLIAALGDREALAFADSAGNPYEPGDELGFAIQVAVPDLEAIASFDVFDELPSGFTYKPGSGRLVTRSGGLGSRVETAWEPVVNDVLPALCGPQFGEHDQDGDTLTWNFQNGAVGPAGAIWNGDTLGDNTAILPLMDSWNLARHQIDGFVELRYEVVFDSDCVQVPIHFQQFNNRSVTQNIRYIDGEVIPSGVSGGGGNLGPSYIYPFDFVTVEKTPDGGYAADDSTTGFDITVTNYAPVEFGGELIDELGIDVYHLDAPTITDTFSTAGGSYYVPGTATAINQDGVVVPMTEVSVTTLGDTTTVVWQLPDMPGSDTTSYTAIVPGEPYADPEVWTIHVPIEVPFGELDGTLLENHVELRSPMWDWIRTDDADIVVINPSPAPVPAKSSNPAEATINDVVTYSVALEIPRQTVYFDLSYEDLLPDGLEFMGYLGATCIDSLGDNCLTPSMVSTIGTQSHPDGSTTLGWFLGDLVGASEDRTVTLRYRARVEGALSDGTAVTTANAHINVVEGYSNDADRVTATPTDIDPSSYDYASGPIEATLPIVEPEVTVTKSILDPTTPRGPLDTVTYTLTVQNTGDSPAYDVRIVDDPPSYLTNITPVALTGAEVDGWTPEGPHMEWYFGSLAPGASVSIEYTAQVVGNIDDFGLLTIDNVASASAYRGRDLEQAGNRTYVGTEVTGSVPVVGPQIHVEKYADAACVDESVLVNVGDTVPFCIQVTNPGTGTMRFVDVKDLLPAGWTYEVGSASTLGSSEPTVLPGIGGTQLLTWNLGDVVNGGPPIVLRYRATPSASTAAFVRNLAFVEGRNALGDRMPTSATAYRDSDTADAALFNAALEIKKTPDFLYLPYVPTGGPLTWEIEVSNPSPATHSNVIVTDTLPVGMGYTAGSATSPDPGFSELSVMTDGLGRRVVQWRFASLPPGATYRINIDAPIPSGLSGITSYLNDVSAVSDQIGDLVANQARVVVYGPNAIGDKTFVDLNGDGIQQPNDPALPGVTVELRNAAGAVVRTAVTDSFGEYLFDALEPGTYSVRFLVPAGWEFTGSDAGSDDLLDSDANPVSGVTAPITVVSEEDQFGWDAGFVRRAIVGDFVWNDQNGNGVQEAGEPGLAGALVELLDGTGAVIASRTTDTTGAYEFANLLPGSYSIRVTPPAGAWKFSDMNTGTDGTLDSDVDPNGRSAAFLLVSGQTDRTRDAGLFEPVDLAIQKTTPIATAHVGANVAWNLTVTNTTDRTAYAPTHVIDPLPDYLEFVSVSSEDWDCNNAGQIVDCVRMDDILPGDTSEIVVVTKVVRAAPELINVARVESPLDTDPTNNEDDAEVFVLAVVEEPPSTTTTTSVAPPSGSVPPVASAPRPPAGALPYTGASTMLLALVGGLLTGMGGLLVVSRRRRRIDFELILQTGSD